MFHILYAFINYTYYELIDIFILITQHGPHFFFLVTRKLLSGGGGGVHFTFLPYTFAFFLYGVVKSVVKKVH